MAGTIITLLIIDHRIIVIIGGTVIPSIEAILTTGMNTVFTTQEATPTAIILEAISTTTVLIRK